MTPKSLGLRTGSYGSLQSNGVSHNHAVAVFPRKPSKAPPSVHREKEKEKVVTRGCRCLYRHYSLRVILFCLVILVVVVGACREAIWSTSTNIPEVFQHPKDYVKDLKAPPSDSKKDGNNSRSGTKIGIGGRPLINVVPSALHPCKSFKYPPPPPPNSRRLGPRPCPVCYLPVDQAVASMPSLPSESPVLRNLNFVHEENPSKTEPHGGSGFGGYPSLKQRNDSFDIKESMTVHCGFVKGSRPGRGSGFDIDEDDLSELDKYYDVIVASAIFGNYDVIQEPDNISDNSKKHVPFFMFIDEETEEYMRNKSVLNSSKMVGLWRIIVVHNIPYGDSRRNGKIPKLLLHRLFPNVRYSIWIDGKLKLVRDPFQLLERFLWRENATFAISRHYRRFDVFVEAEANKAGAKYDNSSIDYQIDFYRKEGLTPYSAAKLPITSDVPEGCVIIREHIPVTNLYTCLWFNEVDRFTSRDQLSFSTVRDKIMSKIKWSINMFLDCERRNFVIQAYHRELLEHMPPPPPPRPPRLIIRRQPPVRPSPVIRNNPVVRAAGRKSPSRRGRERRSGSRRHRKVVAGSRDNFF